MIWPNTLFTSGSTVSEPVSVPLDRRLPPAAQFTWPESYGALI